MKYIIRSVKYFIALCVLCTILMGLMFVTDTSATTLDQTIYLMLHTDRYATLFVAILVLSVVYPRFGFIKRRIEGDTTRNREQIINAFRAAGFALHGEQQGVMVFRAEGLFQKLMLLWEDEIFVSQEGTSILIDGIRRGVARVEYRLGSYIEMTKND